MDAHFQLFKDLGSVPSAYDYGDFIPGWEPFCAVFTRLRHILAIVAEVLVTIHITLQQEDAQSRVFFVLIIAFLLVNWLSPIDAVGGKGTKSVLLKIKLDNCTEAMSRLFILDKKQGLQPSYVIIQHRL